MTQNEGKKQTKADQVYNYTASKLNYLHSKSDSGPGKALMAIIRRGVSRKPGELPELWGLIFEGMPEELFGKKSTSYAEWAVYTALTLYALHQQGHQDEKKDEHKNWMYVQGISLGKAVFIGPFRHQGIINVRYGNDLRVEMNLIFPKSVRIAPTV